MGSPRSGVAVAPSALLDSGSYLTDRYLLGSERGCGSFVEFAHNGNSFRVSRRTTGTRTGGGTRSEISHFSEASRKSLLMKLNSIDRVIADAGQWIFVTLTYHLREVTARETKDHLKQLKASLYGRFGPDVCGIWKLEPQKRGKPHFHMLLHVAEHVDRAALRAFFVKRWHRIADPDSPEHLKLLEFVGRTERGMKKDFFQPMRSWSQVIGYAAKYCGKVIAHDPDWSVPGRFWGVINKPSFKRLSSVVRARVSEGAAIWVARQLRRYISHRETGRVDVIASGERLTLDRRLCRVPGFVDGQALVARSLGGTLKRYRYRPKNTRNRSGYASDVIVGRLLAHAKSLLPITHEELAEDAARDVDRFMAPVLDAQRAARHLHRSMPRLARSMYLAKRFPPSEPPAPPRPPLTLFGDDDAHACKDVPTGHARGVHGAAHPQGVSRFPDVRRARSSVG